MLHRHILHTRVDATSYREATGSILEWAREGASRYVCVTNVHGVIEGDEDPELRRVWQEADLVTPDGMPLVWALRWLGVPGATRVYGPDLTLHLCAAAARAGTPVALYGNTEATSRAFQDFLEATFPGLEVVCRIAPPFRPLTPAEDEDHTRRLAESGARIVLVSLGCPKQERWMYEHRDRLPAVLVGVGAAFDFHTGRVPQAPAWMQRLGLEWFFRLATEPRRLWPRYARVVPRFAFRFGRQLLATRLRHT